MTFDGKLILVMPADATLRGDVIGLGPHRHILEGAPQPVVDHGIDRLLIAVLPARAYTEEQVGRPAHALHAAGQDQVGVAGADGLGRQHDRLEAGAAHLVHRHRRDGVGQPRLQR